MDLTLILLFSAFFVPIRGRKTYQLIFPNEETPSYAQLHGTIDHPLVDFTLCYWTRIITVHGWGAQFSYNVGKLDNVILTMTQSGEKVGLWSTHVNSGHIATATNILGWLHICVTWTVVESNWNIFINGKSIASGKTGKTEKPLPPNGSVVLGQDQQVDAKFYSDNAFKGQITELHLWDRVLTAQNVSQLFTCSFPEEGNVIGWNQRTWVLHNGVLVSMIDVPCGESEFCPR